jgi:hypothetical protein
VSELLTKYLDLFGRPTKHLIRFIAQSLSPGEKQKLQQLIEDPVRRLLCREHYLS